LQDAYGGSRDGEMTGKPMERVSGQSIKNKKARRCSGSYGGRCGKTGLASLIPKREAYKTEKAFALRAGSFCFPAFARKLACRQTKKPLAIAKGFLCFVGKTGFEPATPWSQTRCATGLRYFPNCKREQGTRYAELLRKNRLPDIPYSLFLSRGEGGIRTRGTV
jgi:hypothetical protein